MGWRPVKRGIKIPLVASCYRHQVKLMPNESLGLNADFRPSPPYYLGEMLWLFDPRSFQHLSTFSFSFRPSSITVSLETCPFTPTLTLLQLFGKAPPDAFKTKGNEVFSGSTRQRSSAFVGIHSYTNPFPFLVFWTVTFWTRTGAPLLVTLIPTDSHLKNFESTSFSGWVNSFANIPVIQSLTVTFNKTGALFSASMPSKALIMSTFSRNELPCFCSLVEFDSEK